MDPPAVTPESKSNSFTESESQRHINPPPLGEDPDATTGGKQARAPAPGESKPNVHRGGVTKVDDTKSSAQ
ncbi:unnamed protein product [Didymodactylos carnosus]|uniref:Uncharacterized protein n=2 Tax=Didymodactylos carnosus TaxID=1234261 RepID=A0A8S2WJB8_9BILA|nr:unnamed protein product [Didymodactylos carnosus]CAF4431677.1 unnamed protein product [Didymodactylos carnosus]